MSSKKKKATRKTAPAATAARTPAHALRLQSAKLVKPAWWIALSRREKATITRFARDIAEEHKSNPASTVYKIKRALGKSEPLCATILSRGGRAWGDSSFVDQIDALVDTLPMTVFRAKMTPDERIAARKAKLDLLLADAVHVSAVSQRALRAAAVYGLKGEERKRVGELFTVATRT